MNADRSTAESSRQANVLPGRNFFLAQYRDIGRTDAQTVHRRAEEKDGGSRKIPPMESHSVASVDSAISRIDRRNLA